MNTHVNFHKTMAEILLAIPRIVCGLLLTLDFGSDKFGMPWSPPEKNLNLMEVAFWFPFDVAEYGGVFTLFPQFLAWMGAFSEAVGGVFLILGLFTRPFAFLTLCTMSVAIFMQQWGQGTWNMLPALGFLWVSLYLLVLGSGKFGLDHWLPIFYDWIRSFRWGKPLLWISTALAIVWLLCHAGVQDIRKQIVLIHVKSVDGEKISSMVVRGSDNPLSWQKDHQLNVVIPDSLYTTRLEFYTGYLYTEMKLVRNGEFEFQDADNRILTFDADGTTEVDFIYNQLPKSK
ncbi:MAG: DoxX family protein [Saprospiraceae bacterium]|nr:DoxX family protein [Saprospiraceae bacterium]